MATGGPGMRGGMHAAGMNADPSAGIFCSLGSADSTVGEHDLQLAEHQVPVLTSGTPAFRDALGSQVTQQNLISGF